MSFEKYVTVTLRDVDIYDSDEAYEFFIITKEALKQADEIDKHWYEYAEDDNYEFSFDIEKYLQDEKESVSKYNIMYCFLSANDCTTAASRLYEC